MPFASDLALAYALAGLALLINMLLLVWVAKLSRHYNSLTHGVEPKSLMRVLEGIQRTLSEHEARSLTTKADLKKLTDATRLHLQHLTLKRFNPFGDTGGDQSFILAILDGNSDGVMITSLHSRENTRFYVKSIKGGVGIDHPLSKEEQKIIKR